MIESLSIANAATYGQTLQTFGPLKRVNFVYGANGSGKTTISRVIADPDSFADCAVAWSHGAKLEPMVYNTDFVERNYEELKGVFTLGEEQVEVRQQIADANQRLADLQKKIDGLTETLQGTQGQGGKKGELAALGDELKEQCWKQKQKRDEKLKGAFEGYRNNAVRFRDRVLQEYRANSAALVPLADLEKRAETVFGATPTLEAPIPAVSFDILLQCEGDPILSKRVIGRDDVDIADMINKLGNSDWVRQGRPFYDLNDRVCPFCQQETTEAFASSLNQYFDDTFADDTSTIADLQARYAEAAKDCQQRLADMLGAPPRFLDAERLKTSKGMLDAFLALNEQRITQKQREPSQVVELDSVRTAGKAVTEIIAAANAETDRHNAAVQNLAAEREQLTAQVWRFVLNELQDDLSSYDKKRADLNKAITSLSDKIACTETQRAQEENNLKQLERRITSVQPTVDAINSLLSSFGFSSFMLAKADDGTSYRLVRPDGSDAKRTLSEGERNFVAFLYFYHLVRGSHSETGVTGDRIVVFDDPVSSLDSEILFMVGSLIKALINEARDGSGQVKQVFVLTHNVYFHREVTFRAKRSGDDAMADETFWVVRNTVSGAKLETHPTNPVKTSYDLLWAEVRRKDPSPATIQNTLRRILESYFKILGGAKDDEICAKFQGKDRQVCESLFSWMNAGSHHTLDDLYVSLDNVTVAAYLDVFKRVFEASGHEAHYNMMMGEAAWAA